MIYATKSASFKVATSGRPTVAPAPRPVARRLVAPLRASDGDAERLGDKASEAARDAQKSVSGDPLLAQLVQPCWPMLPCALPQWLWHTWAARYQEASRRLGALHTLECVLERSNACMHRGNLVLSAWHAVLSLIQ